jgi:hypothetical protein
MPFSPVTAVRLRGAVTLSIAGPITAYDDGWYAYGRSSLHVYILPLAAAAERWTSEWMRRSPRSPEHCADQHDDDRQIDKRQHHREADGASSFRRTLMISHFGLEARLASPSNQSKGLAQRFRI